MRALLPQPDPALPRQLAPRWIPGWRLKSVNPLTRDGDLAVVRAF